MKTKCLFANPRLSRLFDHFLSVRERASLEVNFGEERNSIRLHTPNKFLTVSQTLSPIQVSIQYNFGSCP